MKKRKCDIRVNVEKDYFQDQLVFENFLYQVLPEM